MKKIYLIIAGLIPVFASSAQTLTDGLMMQKKSLCTGVMYTHDQWKQYWEGDLKRENGNIGKLTTQSYTWVGTYGITDRINIIAMLPYVKTNASQGTLHGMEGFQDVSAGVKYNFWRQAFGEHLLKTFATINFSAPAGWVLGQKYYTPDFYPLSLGASSRNITYRTGAWFRHSSGVFVNASFGYTWRSNVKLDRIAYYQGNPDNGNGSGDNNVGLVRSNEVWMPNIFDTFVTMGYQKGALQAELGYMQQNTLGGADIRRQDMPFVSNRMNFIKVNALVMYYLPRPKGLAVRASYGKVVDGRNVGQSTTLMAGALYTIHFSREAQQ